MLICNCKEIKAIEIAKFVKKHPQANFTDLKKVTGVSTGCGRCHSLAQNTFEKYSSELPKMKQYQIEF